MNISIASDPYTTEKPLKMPRKSLNVEVKNGGKCKIRKRGNSSSSSSSLVRNYRLKRAILVGKRGGSSTPVPTWKMSTGLNSLQNDKGGSSKGKEGSASARKLAATLWEINEVQSPNTKDDLKGKKTIVKSSRFGSMADLSRSPVSEYLDGQSTKKSVRSHQFPLADKTLGLDSLQNADLIKVENHSHRHRARSKTHLKDISECLTTSKELLKVLNHISDLDSTSKSLISALKFELHQAHVNVEKLIQEQKSDHSEIGYLLKQFEEERSTWKMKTREKIHNAIKSMAGELDVEKRLRKQVERLNKKLGRELGTTRALLSKAEKDVKAEKRAREILEQVCEELATGIGEDRAEVEELKKENVKVREEVEKEREMLQVADVLREERVQMKLLEAKYQFEEKNEAVDKLRSELEAKLKAEKGEEKGNGYSNYDTIKELEEYLQKTLVQSYQGDPYRGSSADSDLQSIELNMDNNGKSYGWSYACGFTGPNDSKIISIADGKMGRNSISEKSQKKTIYLERQISDGIEWEFNAQSKEDSDGLKKERFFEFTSKAQKEDYEDEIERYKMIKDLRDHIVSGSGLAMLQGAA